MVVDSTSRCVSSDEQPPVSGTHVQTTEYQLPTYRRWQKSPVLAGAHGSAEQQRTLLIARHRRTPFLDTSNQCLGPFAGDLRGIGVDGPGVAIQTEGVAFGNHGLPQRGL